MGSRGFLLVLDGQPAGVLRRASGGAVAAEVVLDPGGSRVFRRKHLGPPRAEELALYADMEMAPPFYAWLGAAWNGQAQRKSGSLIGLDFAGRADTQLDFFDAVISEVSRVE